MFRTVPLPIIRSFSLYTQQWCMSCRFADSLRAGSGRNWQFRPDPARKLYDIYHCCVQWKTPDDGQRNCAKLVEFCSKNKFEKLEHLLGFIIRIYHDARSPERQIHKYICRWVWFSQTARCKIPEGSNLHVRLYEKLKPHKWNVITCL